MAFIKRGDLIKTIAKQTKLSARRSKEVIKKAGITDVGAYPQRALTKDKQIKLIKNLAGAITKSGYKVRGLKDPYRFRQNLKKNLTQTAAASEASKNPPKTGQPREGAVDFLQRVRQRSLAAPATGPGAGRERNPLVSGNALNRQPANPAPQPDKKPLRFERVSLADNAANIEAITNRPRPAEPIAPDIG